MLDFFTHRLRFLVPPAGSSDPFSFSEELLSELLSEELSNVLSMGLSEELFKSIVSLHARTNYH